MFDLFSTDAKLALRLEELASQLDAGLPPGEILPGVGLDSGLVAALRPPEWPLDPTERSVLEAAEQAGRLPDALRERAAARRQRAELRRELISGLRYPILVLLVMVPVGAVAGMVAGGAWAAIAGLGIPVALVMAGIALRRAVRSPTFHGGGIPGLRSILHDAAEIPYLEALGGLYRAGVGLLPAHSQALRAVPVASVRARLFLAAQLLEGGDIALGEALARTSAVQPETLQILQPAERAGALEEALGRALDRRRHTLASRTSSAIRLFSGTLYAVVVVLVALLALDFYGSLYRTALR